MPLTSFRVGPAKALMLAEAHNVPKLMIIAGPNGVGKSTLLFQIKRRQGQINVTGKILYLAPHRMWRRQSVQRTQLFENFQSLSDVLAADQVPRHNGLNIFDGSRTPDSADEAWNTIKHLLSKFESRFNDRAVARLRAKGKVTLDEMGDIYQPLRDITRYLLPHLVFERVDLETAHNVRCLFKRADNTSSTEIDLDDLSSGERSIISMFLPFIEAEIDEKLKGLEAVSINAPLPGAEDKVVLLDEPELHLHPLLQSKVLDYLRELAGRGGVQFIIVTHSPSIVAAANFDELFVLSPPAAQGVNQLVQLANTAERLDLMRSLSGDTHVLTTCRGIICVEGESPKEGSRGSTDKRILELINPELNKYILLPFGGKGNAVKASQRLRELMGPLPVVSVSCLLDSDRDGAPVEPWIAHLPVAMIENLLLIPEAIWSFVEPHREKVGLNSAHEVAVALNAVASGQRGFELELRLRGAFRIQQPDVKTTSPEDIAANLLNVINEWRSSVANIETIKARVRAAEKDVDDIFSRGMALTRFHGKRLLSSFYELHIKKAGFGHDAFVLELARRVGSNDAWSKPLREAVSAMLSASKATTTAA